MDRHKGGTYVCTANNGVGKPASSQVLLHVLCKSNYFNWNFLLYKNVKLCCHMIFSCLRRKLQSFKYFEH